MVWGVRQTWWTAHMQVEELAKAKLEKPKRLRELAAREWREIDDGTLVFGRPAAEVAALRSLTKSDVMQFFQVLPLPGSPSIDSHLKEKSGDGSKDRVPLSTRLSCCN